MMHSERLVEVIDRFFVSNDLPNSIAVAVSGGSDSMALLHAFHAWGKCPIHAVTVDHGLRPEAKLEAAEVAKTCALLGVPHRALKWDRQSSSGNVMSEARDARYALMADWCSEENIPAVVLGHTADDVAETFLMRLARGSGVDGLSQMPDHFDRASVTFYRPFLSEYRADLRQFLQDSGVSWIDDPSNDNDSYDRVRMRRALTLLDELGVRKERLVGTAKRLRASRQTLEQVASRSAQNLVRFEHGDVILHDPEAFFALPQDTHDRILIAMLKWVSGSYYPPRRAALDEVSGAMKKGVTQTLSGVLITSREKEIRLSRELKSVELLVSVTDAKWDGRWTATGPSRQGIQIKALSEAGLAQCPGWREANHPRSSLISLPAAWHGEELIAAPLVKLTPNWRFQLLRGEKQFFSTLFAH